jgi:23S rRNA (cytidine1920-2'-O)/16S rRNA (cytidine1409-2'-O)-methyltransferase
MVSRAAQKLSHALDAFGIDVTERVCADLGCNVGGFVQVLLERGARTVYAIDTGYGVLDWKLRKDARVVVMERTNAMHAVLPEKADCVTIDVAWTRQRHIIPNALRMIRDGGLIVTLIKPHYEADKSKLRDGVLERARVAEVLRCVESDFESAGAKLEQIVQSPIEGSAGNVEFLAWLRRAGTS